MTNPICVAVTGATGLVGSHLVNYLGAKGYRIIALVHSKGKVDPFKKVWSSFGVSIREGDVRDQKKLSNTLDGADVVVHAAGVIDPYGSREHIFTTNVTGTKNVLLTANQISAKQFILVSSLSVITGMSDQYNVTEDAAFQICGEAYADSKVEAEKLVLEEAKDLQSNRFITAVTIVRPGFIYGPGERAWLPRLINSIASQKAMLIDGGNKETNVIYVENLNKAIESTILNPVSYGQVYNLTDGQKVTKKQLFDTISADLSLPYVTKSVPGFLAKFFCELVSNITPILPLKQKMNLARYSRAAFRLAGLNQGFSIAKAERELNYTDRIPFHVGMAATLQSFKCPEPSSPEERETATVGNPN